MQVALLEAKLIKAWADGCFPGIPPRLSALICHVGVAIILLLPDRRARPRLLLVFVPRSNPRLLGFLAG